VSAHNQAACQKTITINGFASMGILVGAPLSWIALVLN